MQLRRQLRILSAWVGDKIFHHEVVDFIESPKQLGAVIQAEWCQLSWGVCILKVYQMVSAGRPHARQDFELEALWTSCRHAKAWLLGFSLV